MAAGSAAGVLAVGTGWALLPSAGATLLALLVVAGIVAPWLTYRAPPSATCR